MSKLFILFSGIALLGMIGCESNLSSIDEQNDQVNIVDIDLREKVEKDCISGAFTMEQGMMRFENEDAFQQTLTFLDCSTFEEIDNWRNVHPVETSMKAYLAFKDASAHGKISTLDDLVALEQEYDGKIHTIVDEKMMERSHTLEHPILSDIVDIDGLFQIENDMIRIDQGRFIRVYKTTREEILAMDIKTPPVETDEPEAGDVIENIEIELRDDPDCCPSKKSEERFYTRNGSLYKIIVSYNIWKLQRRIKRRKVNGTFYVKNSIQLKERINISHEKRKRFTFWTYWASDNTDLSLDYNYKIHYEGVNNTDNGTEDIEGYIEKSDFLTRTNASRLSVGRHPIFELNDYKTISFCIEEIEVTGKDAKKNESITLLCPMEEEEISTPVIIFYEDNNLGGDVVCALDLDPSTGYLNFKDYSPCANDEARSARLINMREGMRLRVFDSPEMKLNDDFTIIDIKKDFDSKAINSFEKSTNDSEMKLTYFKDNGLDGKISSFIDN